MSRIRLTLLAVFAAAAVAVIMSSSASAACSIGTKSVWCDHTNTEITNELALGAGGLYLISTKVGGAKVKIHCADDTFHGLLLKSGTGEGNITYLSCSVVEPVGCTVTQPIVTEVLVSLSEGVLPPTGLLTGAKTGEKLAEITIGACSVAGTYPVTGLQTVELPSAETFLANQEFVATKANSKMKFGVEALSYSNKLALHLKSSLPWGVKLCT